MYNQRLIEMHFTRLWISAHLQYNFHFYVLRFKYNWLIGQEMKSNLIVTVPTNQTCSIQNFYWRFSRIFIKCQTSKSISSVDYNRRSWFRYLCHWSICIFLSYISWPLAPLWFTFFIRRMYDIAVVCCLNSLFLLLVFWHVRN